MNNIAKITVTFTDGTTQDFTVPAALPTQIVKIAAGETIEIQA